MYGHLNVAYQSLRWRLTFSKINLDGNIMGHMGVIVKATIEPRLQKNALQGHSIAIRAKVTAILRYMTRNFFLANSEKEKSFALKNSLQVHMSDILPLVYLYPHFLSVRACAQNAQKMRSSTRTTNWADAFSCACSEQNISERKKGTDNPRWDGRNW